ncbi:MAG: nicotinate-nucleotide adenylyltransferase [Betaproteobacteria bacterium]|nr:nicotinate-nucleotide adenylyltransferase [Betaproteobacteria bacterium]
MIGLYGGTFDPIHLGHVSIARLATQALPLSQLIVLPAGNPWQRGRQPLASAEARLAMLHLAFDDDAKIIIDDRELRRSGPTYTVDTLTELRHTLGHHVPLVWLIGADAFAKLDSWHRWQDLFGLTHFAVTPRAGIAAPVMSEQLTTWLAGREVGLTDLAQGPSGWFVKLDITAPPTSSTQIRGLLAERLPVRGLVPDTVCDYIEQHHLYSLGKSAFHNG